MKLQYYCFVVIVMLMCSFINCERSKYSTLFTFFEFSLKRNYKETECTCQLQQLAEGIRSRENWALDVYNTWGKYPWRLHNGTIYDFGDFDGCLSLEHEIKHEVKFRGQYCQIDIIDYKHGITEEKFAFNVSQFGLTMIGICVPSVCDPSEIHEYITEYLSSHELKIKNKELVNCYTDEEPDYSAMNIFGIIFFSLIVGIMIISTAHEMYMLQIKGEPHVLKSLFSIYTNGSKLFSLSTPISSDSIPCINGIRVLSLFWIMYAHIYVVHDEYVSTISNRDFDQFSSVIWNKVRLSATYAVDTFLTIGGFLLARSVFKELNKSKKLNIIKMYIHRFLRLTPAIAMLILLVTSFYKFLSIGPVWNSASNVVILPCERNWWSSLLYIQNIVNTLDMCIEESWYLAIDMQLFVLSPLLLYPLWKFKRHGKWLILIFTVASLTYTITMLYLIGHESVFDGPKQFLTKSYIYNTPQSRMTPWLMGITLAYFIMEIPKDRVNLQKWQSALGWIVCIGFIILIIIGQFESLILAPLSRLSWGIIICWIIFACHYGYGGAANTILSFSIWQPLAKLSFCMYLLHTQVMLVVYGGARHPKYISIISFMHNFWGDLVFTFVAATFWTLAFEMPILRIENYIIKLIPVSTEKKVKSKKDIAAESPSSVGLQQFENSTVISNDGDSQIDIERR